MGENSCFPPYPFSAFERVNGASRRVWGASAPSNALSRECGALPHTPLPFGSQKEAKSNFAAQRGKENLPAKLQFNRFHQNTLIDIL
ncbi:MAG: hypothetical protein ACI4RK_04865, partial [Oscillospiraceae bacterium]